MPLRFLLNLQRKIRARGTSPSRPGTPPAVRSAAGTAKAAAEKRARRGQGRRAKPRSDGAAGWTPLDFDVPPAEGQVRFHDLQLSDEILRALSDLNFRYCMPIQAKVLAYAREGCNIAGRAQTGTGKSAAFLILMLEAFLRERGEGRRAAGRPRALVLAPTRELVAQIVRDAENLARYTPLRCMAVFGGMDYDRQRRMLNEAPVDILAATPGRLLDFCRRRELDLGGVGHFVIDEADRMLDMGFIPDVRQIVRRLPPAEKRRSLLFSATLTQDVMRLARQWVPDPVVVEVEPEQVAAKSVKPCVYLVRARDKFALLYNLIRKGHMQRVLVFGNRRDTMDRLAGELQRHGVRCALMSGAVPQKQRMRILDEFREGKVEILIATDVAGRGIHVDGISHVVNFDLPYEAEDYVHRIGRTGRAGAVGTAISFACEEESFIIPEIERYVGHDLRCVHPEEDLLAPPPRPARGPSAPRRPPQSGRNDRRRPSRRR